MFTFIIKHQWTYFTDGAFLPFTTIKVQGTSVARSPGFNRVADAKVSDLNPLQEQLWFSLEEEQQQTSCRQISVFFLLLLPSTPTYESYTLQINLLVKETSASVSPKSWLAKFDLIHESFLPGEVSCGCD
ncbi:hypothetical protein CEXT_333241 [Caerostris extrusa]|uniref:Uncharacterized protein n=1 Tax=Caerostris extrusa TaxID=172846 RepID=A0AAV4UBX3_CAEEX|nr:hypothetical protein CEXT_333241 [Caerostris extrusa]